MSASSRTFAGFRRPDGRVGVRNHVLVLSPTGLTSAAAQRVSSLVRGTICVTSGFGRGQVAADAKLHFDTLAGLASHPNVAASRGALRRRRHHPQLRRCGRRHRQARRRLVAARRARGRACAGRRRRARRRRVSCARHRRCGASLATWRHCASPSSADTPTRRRASSAIRSPAA